MSDSPSLKTDDVLSTLSREFVIFDLVPTVVAGAGISTALLLTDGFSEGPRIQRVVDGALAATPSALVIWWFAIIAIAVLIRPFVRVAVRLAVGDPGQAIVDAVPFLATRRPLKNWVARLDLYGPFGSAREAHAVAVGSELGGRSLGEIESNDPQAFKIVRDHRERWELTLRLALATLIASSVSVGPLLGHGAWWIVPALGALSATSMYFQSVREYQQFSTVFLAARKLPDMPAAPNQPA